MSEAYKKNRKTNSGKFQRVEDEQIQQTFGVQRTKSKKQISGGSQRKRYKDRHGKFILEEDTRHGAVEKYRISDGKHLGKYDPQTGKQIKPAKPKRKLRL